MDWWRNYFFIIENWVAFQSEYIFQLKYGTTYVYKLVNIQNHSSEDQHGDHFHTVIYDWETDLCWDCNK